MLLQIKMKEKQSEVQPGLYKAECSYIMLL